jgi:hypothetical protein
LPEITLKTYVSVSRFLSLLCKSDIKFPPLAGPENLPGALDFTSVAVKLSRLLAIIAAKEVEA